MLIPNELIYDLMLVYRVLERAREHQTNEMIS